MKKIFVLLVAAILCFALPTISLAQTSLYSTGNGLTRDTVSNAGNKTLALSNPVLGYKATVTIQVDVTKISGTLAGTIIPVGSNDGTTYYALTGSYTVTDTSSQGVNFSVTTGYRYYGIKWTGTGTMSGSFVAKLNSTKP